MTAATGATTQGFTVVKRLDGRQPGCVIMAGRTIIRGKQVIYWFTAG